MKIKFDFVTNSSSTNFYFCFKAETILEGSKYKMIAGTGIRVKRVGETFEDLFRGMRKYAERFKLRFDFFDGKCYTCDVGGVIKAIRNCIGCSDWPGEIKIQDPQEIIDLKKDHIKWTEEQILKEQARAGSVHYLKQEIKDYEKQIEKLEKVKRRGMKVVQIEFGDNHGHVQGGSVGYCMDYEGRSISIDKFDFIVFTEQNR